jgi:chromate transporter
MINLFLIFFRIGCVGFGGLGSVLAIIERDLVTKQQKLTAEDVTEALTYTKLLPGSTVVQVVTYLGYKLGGWAGATVSTIAFVLPAFLVMLILAIAYGSISTLANVQGGLRGLSAAVVGVLVVTCYNLGRKTIKDWLSAGLAVIAFVAAVVFHAPLALIVVGAGLIGLVAYLFEAKKINKQSE